MLDNHDDARPQAQISKADIIYEYRVEGEFTRYMALFQSNFPENVGPVRSARPYFVQTAKEYNAIYAHWGGSVAGLEEVKREMLWTLMGLPLKELYSTEIKMLTSVHHTMATSHFQNLKTT